VLCTVNRLLIGWKFGMHLDLRAMPCEPDISRDDTLLYAETANRFVVTVPQ
jgi:hypothetical protein